MPCKQIGVRIPTLCYHEDLCIAGVCRVCLVEVEGQRTLQASCAYPITAPIKVHTHTRKVRQARRHVIDLLLSKHYGECYTCVRNGNCELQALAKEYGVNEFRFGHPETPRFEVDDSSFSIVRDNDKCVLCRRCVRTCIDLQEVGVLEAIGRSDRTEIAAFMKQPLGGVICINCGQCINRCPTGALHAKDPSDEIWARHRRPGQARRHPDRAQPARGHRRMLRPRTGHAADARNEYGAAALRFRQAFSTPTSPPTSPSSRKAPS